MQLLLCFVLFKIGFHLLLSSPLCHCYSILIKILVSIHSPFENTIFCFRVMNTYLVSKNFVSDQVPVLTSVEVKNFPYVLYTLLFVCNICREKVRVAVNKPYVSFVGKRNQTASPVITWNSKSSDRGTNGQALGTFDTATVGVDSDYFCATGITFEVTTQFLYKILNTFKQPKKYIMFHSTAKIA